VSGAGGWEGGNVRMFQSASTLVGVEGQTRAKGSERTRAKGAKEFQM